MPTTSCKEPTKESQDTKPSVVKWGYEGPFLIYLVLPPVTKARTLVGQGAHDCGQGAYGGGKGMHVCEGARMGVGKARTPAGVGANASMGGGGAHGCWRVRTHAGRVYMPARRGSCTSAGGTQPCREGSHAYGGRVRTPARGGMHVLGGARTFSGGRARMWGRRTLGYKGSAQRWKGAHEGGEGAHASTEACSGCLGHTKGEGFYI
jgi:hypothetical protein